ncbi:hypothetical protein [Nocardioides sp.]|uniref:hypothetical protein n=1 Tax=Nocardioides sp. TaxID=35761 RepID=UPI003561FED0
MSGGICTVTVWPVSFTTTQIPRGRECGEPTVPGARLCEKHHADRMRLLGQAVSA